MNHRSHWINRVIVCALIGAGPALAKEPSIETDIRFVAMSRDEVGCSGDLKGLDSFGGEMVTLLGPPLLEAGCGMLGAAITEASGVNDTTHVETAKERLSFYSIDTETQSRVISDTVGCLIAYAPKNRDDIVDLKEAVSSPQSKVDFLASFAIVVSTDRTAFAAILKRLYYPTRFSTGRKVTGASLQLKFYTLTAEPFAAAVLPFEAKPSPDSIVYQPSTAPSTPWLPLPEVSATASTLLTSYETACATRRSAASTMREERGQAIEALVGKREDLKKEGKLTPELDQKVQSEIAALAAEMNDLQEANQSEANSNPCKYVLPAKLVTTRKTNWSERQEKVISQQEDALLAHGPVTAEFGLTETKDVNKFLETIGAVFTSKKAELGTAAANHIIPSLREAKEKERADAALASEVAALELVADYQKKLAAFQEKKRLYDSTMVDLDSTPETKAAALQAALEAKYDALIAAMKASISPPDGLRDFPSQ